MHRVVPLAFAGAISLICISAPARDLGQYDTINPAVRQWFKGLHDKGNVSCCDFADGSRLEDPDWRMEQNGTYSVRLDGDWKSVPEQSVITERNRVGFAVVWTFIQYGPNPGQERHQIRCFMPGPQT